MSRFRLLAAAGLVAALLAVAGCGSTATHIAAPSHNVGTQLDGAVPASIENLPLVDATGRTRHLSDFAGKVVVISDVMTLCQESCPLDTAALVQSAESVDAAQDASKVEFLTITIDPARDTVPQLAAYRRLYQGPANWLTLTGKPATIAMLWKYLGVYIHKVPADHPAPKNWRTGKTLTYDLQHSDETFFLDGRGQERFVLDGMPHIPDQSQIPAPMYHYLSQEGRDNVAHPATTAWTEPQALDVLSWLLDQRIAS